MIRKNLLLTLLMALFVPLAALAQNAPTNLSVVLRPDDPTVAYLKWDPAGSETQWTLNYWTNPNWEYYSTKQVDNMPQQRLTGLTPNTTYYVRVRTRSGSTYSETFSFTTKDFHQIGDVVEGQTSTYIPTSTSSGGGFSVQYFDVSTINNGEINRISFYVFGTENEWRDIRIFMNDERKDSWYPPFASAIFSETDLVYSGWFQFKPGWNEIQLSKTIDLTYYGNHNLLVWLVDETEDGNDALEFACFNPGFSQDPRHLYVEESVGDFCKNSDGSYVGLVYYGVEHYDWNNPANNINDYYLRKNNNWLHLNKGYDNNVIRLGYKNQSMYLNAEVYGLSTDVTGEGSARLEWSGYNAQHYVLQYSTYSDFPTNLTTTKYLYDNSFYLSGLSPTTTYYWRVKAVGAFNETGWSEGTSFKPSKQVAIGSGTATNFYLPFNNNYKYYLSQQIYTASEMTKAGIVESVTFECSALSNPETRNLDIYMVHTDKTQFNSESDWVPVTPDDLVFSGPVTFQNGLNRIRFNSGFEYDGQRNVVLVVDDNTGEYGGTHNFAVFTTPNLNQSITYGNSFNNVDVQNTSGFSQYSVSLYSTKNRVTFEINTPSGMNKPTGLAATLDPDTPTEATLGWTENGTATRWNVRYGTVPSFADCQTIEVSGTPQAQLTGLTPETTYYAQVRSLQNSSSAWSAPIAFVPTDKIVVGAGEAISSILPTWGIITTISQQIYTADELLNEPRLIESVSFYCENIEFTRSTVGIFMMHTDKEVFDNTNDMLDTDNAEMVYNGEVTFVAGEWTTINFTTPFAYDGTSNVALTVADFSGSQSLGAFPNFKAFETGRNQAIVSYQDSGPMYTQLDTEKNQVRWGVSTVCEIPWHHESQVAYFPGNCADVWWFEMGEATEWTVQHGPNAGFTEGSYTEQNVTGEPYIELKNLTPNSVGEYYVRVRSVCGEGYHSFWSDVIKLKPEASNEICNGVGTSTVVLPTSPNYYNYYLSQQIYTRQELRNMPCAIGSVEFSWQNTAFPVRNLDIYMVHTDKTQFDSNNDWVQVTPDDLVFSGETTFGHSKITFNKRFMYDGTSNVVLVVNDKTDAIDANLSELYFVFETENNQALYSMNQYVNIDPLGTLYPAEGIVNMKNCVTFGWEEYPIQTPTMHDPTLIPDDATMVTLSWTENGAATEWVLQYGASDEFGYNFEEILGEITVTGTPTFNLTGLKPWTYYQARVKAVYREGDAEYHSNWSQTARFQTESSLDIDDLWLDDYDYNSRAEFEWSHNNITLAEGQSILYDCSMGTISGEEVTWHDMGSVTNQNSYSYLPVGNYTFRTRIRIVEGNTTIATGEWYEIYEPFSIVTADPVHDYPFTFGFEGYAHNFLQGLNLSGTLENVNRFEFGTEATTGIAPHGEGSSYLCFHHDGNESHEASVVLPMFYSASPTQMALSFWLYNSAEGSGSTLSDVAAYVSSDGENWTIISGSGVYGAECRGAWHRYVCSFNLTGEAPITPHAYVRLRFVCVEDAPEQYFCLDDISVKPIADYKPYISQATSTAYSVTLSVIDNAYEAGSGSEQYEVEYRAVGTDSWTTMAFMMEAPYENYVQLTVDGLDPNTYYEFRAFSKIPTGKSNIILWTDESNTVTKWTDNGPFIVSPGHPYEFGFETAAGNWTANEWDTEYTSTSHTGEQCAYMSSADISELVTPEIHFDPSCDNIVIRFWVKGSGRIGVYYGENYAQRTDMFTISNKTNWTKLEYSLSRFMIHETVKVAFRNDQTATTPKEMWIDDIEIVANAYDKVFDCPGGSPQEWSNSDYWYPHGMPASNENVMINGIANVGDASGSSPCTALANNIEFGTYGYIMVQPGSILEATEINVKTANNVSVFDGGQLKVANDSYAQMIKRFVGYEDANSSSHWYLFAYPLKGSGLPSGFTTGDYDLYSFDGAADLEWLNYKNHGFQMQNGKGYLYAHAKPTSGSNDYTQIGMVSLVHKTTEDRTVTGLTYGENTEANPFYNWNLVGNPYPCNAYLSGNRAFYRLEETAEGSRIVLAEDNVIKPMEGVFVQAETSAESSVTFTTTEPTLSNGLNFTMSKKSVTRGAESVIIDRARISFSQGKGMGHLDLMADANRLYIPQSGKDMAVVCSEPAGEMPLNFEAAENGTYTLGISLNDTELVYCHLIDNLTGADVDLLATSTGSVAEYTFEAKTTDYRSRFKVVFVAKSAFEGDNASNFAFFTQGNWIIANEGRATLQVIDMNGRILSSESINGNATTQINAAAGMYLLRLVNGNDVKTQKIVVD